MAIDEAKLNEFMGRAVMDMGGCLQAALAVIGDRLGLYKGMAAGPVTPAELAKATKTDERYVREWLSSQAAGGYCQYDAKAGRFFLTDEQNFALATESSPAFLPGAFQLLSALIKDEPKIREAFQTGHGVGWGEHHPDLFEGTERFFRPNYLAHLTTEWIPALDGMQARLQAGAEVADIGCGHGASTILMAKEFPKSRFHGFDFHGPSIEWAREAAKKAGVADRVKFETAAAKNFPGQNYDLVTFFDCLHDMGDPVGAASHVRQSLSKNGMWMLVEPFANDKLEDNLNPVGRIFYGASTLVCTPASKAQEVGLALGAQAGEARLRGVLSDGGFTKIRRAAETPFNLVFEAKA